MRHKHGHGHLTGPSKHKRATHSHIPSSGSDESESRSASIPYGGRSGIPLAGKRADSCTVHSGWIVSHGKRSRTAINEGVEGTGNGVPHVGGGLRARRGRMA